MPYSLSAFALCKDLTNAQIAPAINPTAAKTPVAIQPATGIADNPPKITVKVVIAAIPAVVAPANPPKIAFPVA